MSTFFAPQQKRCLPCPQGCLSCESSYKCTQCSVDFNFNIASDLCIEFCGDGKRYNLPCDDGNNNDGDGCSRNCEVEIGYICRGGSPNSVDDCVLYQPTELTMIQTGYIRYSTRIIINIKVDYVPRELLQSNDCMNECSNVLEGTILSGSKPISIKSKYIAGTTYSFSM